MELRSLAVVVALLHRQPSPAGIRRVNMRYN